MEQDLIVTSNSPFEIKWRRDVMKGVFNNFDEDGDGKLCTEELGKCLSSCYGLQVNDNDIRKIFPFEEDNKIEIEKILQAFDDNNHENNFYQILRKMDSFILSLPLLGFTFKDKHGKAFNCVKPDENHVVIDINQLNVSMPPIPDEFSNISELRDMFLGLTGQAAISFIAYAPSTRPLHIIVAANALAFLILLLSFWLRHKKLVAAERIMGSIGISFAVLVFFLMMGIITIPVEIM